MSYEEKMNDFKTRMEELQREMNETGQNYFKDEVALIFQEFPNLLSFTWTQYTPYFNDGDECVFRVNAYPTARFRDEPVVDIEDDYDYFDEDEGMYWNPWTYDPITRERTEHVPTTEKDKLAKRLTELLVAVPQDTFKVLFGDHARIIVSLPAGEIVPVVTVESYEHE